MEQQNIFEEEFIQDIKPVLDKYHTGWRTVSVNVHAEDGHLTHYVADASSGRRSQG